MNPNIEKPAAIGAAALAAAAAVAAGVSVADAQTTPGEAAAKVANLASVLPTIEQLNLTELMTSNDTVLAIAVQAAREMQRETSLSFAFQN